MTNKQIYRKTLTFSLRKLFIDLIALVAVGAFATLGFVLMDRYNSEGLVGLLIGLIVGMIIIAIIMHFIGYTYKAGQIAMMTKGVTEGTLPDHVYREGKKAVKERFGTVAVFYLVTNAIRSIFNALARGINALGKAVGGERGGQVADAVNSAIQVVIGFLCDCCLGWVFYRKEVSAAKATCEGAVIFFKHGKTLIKNVGRIFGMGLLSLLLIGGALFGVGYFIFLQFPQTFELLAGEISQMDISTDAQIAQYLQDPKTLTIIAAAVIAVIIWSFIHSTFVRPFILVGVLRNFTAEGIKDIPTEESFSVLDGKSAKLAKLRASDY
ncbi:MAG: hypothetical protein IJU49_07220 [Lachnospiraceae bacterium]|nr:hypothetical protein [Lachnospiraceae bacterium]